MDGNLRKNAILESAGEAIDLANKWYMAYHSEGAQKGYIAIDQQQEGQEENIRFAILQFDTERENSVRLTINDKGGLTSHSSKNTPTIASYLIPIVEAIVILAEHIRNRKR